MSRIDACGIMLNSVAHLLRTTVPGNRNTGEAGAGGVSNESGDLTLTYSTVTANFGGAVGGGLSEANSGTVSL